MYTVDVFAMLVVRTLTFWAGPRQLLSYLLSSHRRVLCKIFHSDNLALQSFLQCIICCLTKSFVVEATANLILSATQTSVELHVVYRYRIRWLNQRIIGCTLHLPSFACSFYVWSVILPSKPNVTTPRQVCLSWKSDFVYPILIHILHYLLNCSMPFFWQ